MTTNYRCKVTINDVVVGDVTRGDAPDYGVVLPLTFGWRIQESSIGFPAAPDPSTATIRYIDPMTAPGPGDPPLSIPFDINQPVWVQFWADAADTYTWAEFHGTIQEVTATPHPLGMLIELQCVDYLRRLADILVGYNPWPAEAYYDRMVRIFSEASLPLPAGLQTPATVIDARAVGAQTALQAITETTTMCPESTTLGARINIIEAHIDPATGKPFPAMPYGARRQLKSAGAVVSVVDGCLIDTDVEWRRDRYTRPDHVALLSSEGIPIWLDNGTTLVAHPPVQTPFTAVGTVSPRFEYLANWILEPDPDTTPYGWSLDTIRVLADQDPAAVGAGWFPNNDPAWSTYYGSTASIYGGPGITQTVQLDNIDPRWLPDAMSTDPIILIGRAASADFTLDRDRWWVDITLRDMARLT